MDYERSYLNEKKKEKKKQKSCLWLHVLYVNRFDVVNQMLNAQWSVV